MVRAHLKAEFWLENNCPKEERPKEELFRIATKRNHLHYKAELHSSHARGIRLHDPSPGWPTGNKIRYKERAVPLAKDCFDRHKKCVFLCLDPSRTVSTFLSTDLWIHTHS